MTLSVPAFTQIFGLPCKHDIHLLMDYNTSIAKGKIQLKDIDERWKADYVRSYLKLPRASFTRPNIRSPNKAKAKGRPKGARNLNSTGTQARAAKQHETSTRRDLSAYNYSRRLELRASDTFIVQQEREQQEESQRLIDETTRARQDIIANRGSHSTPQPTQDIGSDTKGEEQRFLRRLAELQRAKATKAGTLAAPVASESLLEPQIHSRFLQELDEMYKPLPRD